MQETAWQSEMQERMECEKRAREILGVPPDADPTDIKRAWRQKARKHHPDLHGTESVEQFFMAKIAYSFLMKGENCRNLLAATRIEKEPLRVGQYRLDNAWGYFSWWRDRYF